MEEENDSLGEELRRFKQQHLKMLKGEHPVPLPVAGKSATLDEQIKSTELIREQLRAEMASELQAGRDAMRDSIKKELETAEMSGYDTTLRNRTTPARCKAFRMWRRTHGYPRLLLQTMPRKSTSHRPLTLRRRYILVTRGNVV